MLHHMRANAEQREHKLGKKIWPPKNNLINIYSKSIKKVKYKKKDDNL